MLNLLIQILILIVGGIIFLVFGLFGICYTFLKHLWQLDYSFSKQLTPIVRSITLLLDGFANAASGEFLNDVLKVSKTSKIRYGKWYQTISAITGLRLVIEKIDTKFRKILDKVLGRNHCTEAISKEDMLYYKLIN